MNPNLINAAGCFAAAIYLAFCMKHTHRDDVNKMLLHFEWILLAALILVALDQLKDVINFGKSIRSIASFGVTILWISAFFFSRYLNMVYK
jgi:hypothetical protein